jgi:hypothetical protein
MEGELNMAIHSGITSGTPAKIPFGAGVFFKGVTYDEKVAPTEEAILAGLMGATQDGGSVSITPEFFAPELDGAHVAIKELQNKVGETAEMETSFAELSPELAAHMLIANVGATTDGNYDVLTSADLAEGHFYTGFGYYGKHLDGRPLIIVFKNALCTEGFTVESKNKENSVFKGKFACMSDIDYGTTKLPYAIFIRKVEGWTAANPEDVSA